MSDDRENLLAAIIAQPDDDAVRLVYADWLEEHGDAQAELIRAQIEQEQLPWTADRWWELDERAQVLTKKLGHEQVKQQPKLKNISWSMVSDARTIEDEKVVFRRGLVEVGGAQHFKALNDAFDVLTTSTLLRELRLYDHSQSAIQRLCASPWLPRLRGLTLTPHFGVPGTETIAACPASAGLRQLNLNEAHLGSAGLEAIVGSPYLPNLQYLDLGFNGFTQRDVPTLLQWPTLRRLKALSLSFNRLGAGWATLLQDEAVANLHLLNLRHTDVSDELLAAIGKSQHLCALTHLSLAHNRNLTAAGVSALLADGSLPNLRALSFSDCEKVGDAALAALATSPAAGRLRWLNLGSTAVGTRGLQALAGSPHLRELRSLSIRQYAGSRGSVLTLDPATARALASSPALAKLTYFNIGNMTFAGDAEKILKVRFRQALVRKPYDH